MLPIYCLKYESIIIHFILLDNTNHFHDIDINCIKLIELYFSNHQLRLAYISILTHLVNRSISKFSFRLFHLTQFNKKSNFYGNLQQVPNLNRFIRKYIWNCFFFLFGTSILSNIIYIRGETIRWTYNIITILFIYIKKFRNWKNAVFNRLLCTKLVFIQNVSVDSR